MTERELYNYIKGTFPIENESCEHKEFKSLKHNFAAHEGEDIISYISAISNMNGGHLLIGVKDKSLEIVGIDEFATFSIHNIKYNILCRCLNLSSEGLSVDEIKTTDTCKTVWIISIPKHLPRQPVYAHNKPWQRIGDSLVLMRKERKDAILDEITSIADWSAGIIGTATIHDLDSEAIIKARNEYKKRNPIKAEEADSWDDAIFLNKAKITINGNITRAAIILLGKEEAEHYLDPSVIKIRWSLKTKNNDNKDYEIFSIPLIISVDNLYNKIRNIKYRYVRENTIFPEEMLRYDVFNIREPLNNCIAHQDYSKGARIEVVEFEDDRLLFTNYAHFLPGTVENVIAKDCPESIYRNPFLIEAMRNLNMIETEGGGIKKVFNNQRKRLFPMPEYDLNDGKVKVEIIGRILDEVFANILTQNPELSLYDIMLLDKVQKRKVLSTNEIALLKRRNFIEGRKPNYYLSVKVIKAVSNKKLKADYIRNKNFDDNHYRDMICEYIRKFEKASKEEIKVLLWDKLSSLLNEGQKKSKIQNLLSSLRIKNEIEFGDGFWTIKRH